MTESNLSSPIPALTLGLLATLAALVGCGRTPAPPPAAPEAAQPAPQAVNAQADADKVAAEARAAELAAKEKELADREAALKQQEAEVEKSRHEAEVAAAKAAKAAEAAKRKAAAAKTEPAKVAATAPAAAAPKEAPKPPPKPIYVPAGTQLAVELTAPISTKTAQVGEPVQGRLSADLLVEGRVAAKAGAGVSGVVSKVVSGSKKVGGAAALGITFNQLVVSSGATVPIDAEFLEQGKSDTGADAAKIAGGALLGAVVGNQVSHGKGSVIGGIL
ncbi:MAG TPA: hypothetical protein VMT50_02350, partial [Steroidobacteraceae bacterium]|nr:hypothetical protein [Steroidobacteraceae bacterium]